MATANYSAPPVPPRPYSSQEAPSLPPPIPPLPPGVLRDREEEPLAAPRPQRLNPDLPADMARNLDEQLAYGNGNGNAPRLSTPQPQPINMAINHAPGFVFPGAPPPPPSYGSPPMSDVGSPSLPMPQIRADDGGLSGQMGGLSINGGYGTPPPPRQRAVSNVSPGLSTTQFGEGDSRPRTYNTTGPPPPDYNAPRFTMSPPPMNAVPRPLTPAARSTSSASPSLTAPLPTVASLQAALPAVESPTADVSSRVAWIRDVLLLVNRSTAVANKRPPISIDPIIGPARITDPALQRLADATLPLLISLAPGAPQQGEQLTQPLAEALHMRASLTATGTFPSYLSQNQRTAFREFEAAARSGYSPASWFRLGRDYESFNDLRHAVDCFDRGARAGDESCLYRLGMANLLGQLGMPQDFAKALPMLQRAATLATINVPQPAYVYALILLGDMSVLPLQAPIPSRLINPLVPQGSNAQLEARKHLERAAYLHFTPAQYKIGHAYEFAEPPFPFDALLSVQYYSLASQAGEPEADLALSRWFLCGSEGTGSGDGFKRDESLAFIFGEKAAKKGLPSAEFAMGYYLEVGVGCEPNVEKALSWYELAANHGSNDAVERLTELKKGSTLALTRQEHEVITENKLVRKRTQAKARSDASGAHHPAVPVRRGDANQVLEGIRKNSLQPQPRHSSLGAAAGHQSPPPPMPAMPTMPSMQAMPNASGPTPASIPQDPAARLRDRPRYSLVDPGSKPSSPSPPGAGPHRVASASGGGAGGRLPSGSAPGGYSQGLAPNLQRPVGQTPSLAASPPESKPAGRAKYNTFEEMGVQGGRAEDKDCVIM
ncbi:hypothetical protein ACEPAF_2209 [Sanghuangporus sanghuang]